MGKPGAQVKVIKVSILMVTTYVGVITKGRVDGYAWGCS